MREADVTFGAFRFSPSARTLDRNGEPLVLGGRALDILSALVERAGEVVSHRELMAKVWRGLVVDSGNLRVNIAQLRKALGDAGSLIQNVPRQGYRFAARVHRADERLQSDVSDGYMRALLDCSYRLLSDIERSVLRRIAIFVDAFTLEAAQFVVHDGPAGAAEIPSAMEQLVAKALVTSTVVDDSSIRYRVPEFIRVYLRSRLEEAEEEEFVARRHAEFFARPLDSIGAVEITCLSDPCAQRAVEQLREVRAALQWSLGRN